MCDSQTLCRNFSSHCESFYGCEILNYNMSYMSNLYVSWRKIIRHHCFIVSLLHDHVLA